MQILAAAAVAFAATTCLIADLTARSRQTTGPFGIYGYVHRVVGEPNPSKPTRIQVWGIFSVAVPGSSSEYHAPERGYLYFELPADAAAAAQQEWSEIGKLRDAGVIGFASRGARPRVRTSDERPQQPDRYRPGAGVARASGYDRNTAPSGRIMLDSLLLNELWMNYAIVDKVAFEPNAAEPERAHICGAFAMGTEFGAYAPAQRGCLLVTYPDGASNNLLADIRDEWNAWRAAADTGRIVGFVTLDGLPQVRLRPADERQPFAADQYSIAIDWSAVRLDSTYAPVQALVKLRRL